MLSSLSSLTYIEKSILPTFKLSVAVFADYDKYHRQLEDKNLRKYVPEFSPKEASEYMFEKNLEGIRRGNSEK